MRLSFLPQVTTLQFVHTAASALSMVMMCIGRRNLVGVSILQLLDTMADAIWLSTKCHPMTVYGLALCVPPRLPCKGHQPSAEHCSSPRLAASGKAAPCLTCHTSEACRSDVIPAAGEREGHLRSRQCIGNSHNLLQSSTLCRISGCSGVVCSRL